MEPVFHLLADQALLVTLSDEVSVEVNDRVLRVCKAIERSHVPGVGEAQPAYSSLCVHFDPSKVRASYVQGLVKAVLEQPHGSLHADAEPGTGSPVVEIPVVYGGVEGPDLEWSAEHLGISTEELVRRHTSRPCRVFMVGFTPGFPYLGGMDESIALPRLPQPRAKVPAGSVGIGGNQTGVYPWETPGGWRLLGRTGVTLFSPYRDDPSLLHPGDTVRFVAVESESKRTATAEVGLSGACAAVPSVPGLVVEHPGFFTMVVDEGRFGYRKLGVPVSGAADLRSYRRANLLAGNTAGEAALEMTLLGAKFRAKIDTVVAVTGAPAPLLLDGKQVDMDAPIVMTAGSLLEIGSFQAGCRAYLAASGGIDVPSVMGSRSTYLRGKFGGYQGRFLKAGDAIPVGPAPDAERLLADLKGRRSGYPGIPASITQDLVAGELTLRVVPGPESEPSLLDALCSDIYSVNPESDRMGIRLAGPQVPVGKGDILSSPVVPGTVQVPSDGKPLLLLSDGQTTGGYKRIAVVLSEDLPLAGQLRPGSRVRFRPVRQ